MEIIADLQLHSKYSRAVSPNMTLDEIGRFADIKGIQLVATGDWTHPLWFRSIKDNLVETSKGIFSLKQGSARTKFLLSTEISSIYSQGGKVRRVHNLLFSPSIDTCEKIIKELMRQGCNLMADGRPIVGISSVDLLKIALNIDENILFIPAHAWTPWFAVFGSKSGFDSLSECFGDYAKYIYAIETGLSSDPIMNWQIKELENRSIVSFSDAHSGAKLGREATVFVGNSEKTTSDFTYNDIVSAIRQDKNGRLKIGYTIEFFPEEGKYHWSGHRACNVRYDAKQVKEKGTICPVCNKPLTIGVENRVLDLSEKLIEKNDLTYSKNNCGLTFVYEKEKRRPPFVSMIPLLEILLEINSHSQTKAQRQYEEIVTKSKEFDILLRDSYDEIEKIGGSKLREAVEIIRKRKVFVDPGYDGVFGKVKIFNNQDESPEEKTINQTSLF